jgi:hypothetical protein
MSKLGYTMGLTRIRAQQISDIDYKQAVKVIALSNITLSGGAPDSVDGVGLAAGDRILVAGQSTASQNGLYDVTTLGIGSNGTWTRSSDGNASGEIEAGMIVMVTEGTLYKDTQWKLTTNDPIVIGTTPLAFVRNAANGPAFSAYASATTQTITSGSQQKVLFQVEEFDTDSCFANSRFTPTLAGYYQLNAQVRFDGSMGTGETMLVIWKNGAEYKRGWNASGTVWGSSLWAMSVSSLVYANGAGDYFEIYAQQTSGGPLDITAVNAVNITWFNGVMVRIA